jgi:hypothetical protein
MGLSLTESDNLLYIYKTNGGTGKIKKWKESRNGKNTAV